MIFLIMAEGRRKYNGGNKNVDRKPKVDEQQLIERLSPLEPLAHYKLKEEIEEGERWAVQLYANYMYDKPKTSYYRLNSIFLV
ncbi:MAG: hypothetical protein HKP39_09475 [Eudoraea sp.]|nr:hypothetical protein [Eudoraea sp.]